MPTLRELGKERDRYILVDLGLKGDGRHRGLCMWLPRFLCHAALADRWKPHASSNNYVDDELFLEYIRADEATQVFRRRWLGHDSPLMKPTCVADYFLRLFTLN